jgi:hypothetical protein
MQILVKKILPLVIISGAFFGMTTILPGNIVRAGDQSAAGMNDARAVKIIDRANDILSRGVANEKGEHLGYSKDLIIGKDGCIAYLVLLRGSAFGDIGPLIPIPWSMVTLQEFNKPLLVNVSPDVIRKAPGFTLDNWPNFFSPLEMKDINEYFKEHLE